MRILFIFLFFIVTASTNAQEKVNSTSQEIDIAPTPDSKIYTRLRKILEATEWFEKIDLEVDEGVVTLRGEAISEDRKEWATRLATNTVDVTAVINQLSIKERNVWDFSPAWFEIKKLGKEAVRMSPLIGLGISVIFLFWLLSLWVVRNSTRIFRTKIKSDLLRIVVGRAIAIPIFLIGLYLALKISGLTRLAVTVIGGTGIVGLVLGFAFKDIAENFLASILISIQRPFTKGDLVQIGETIGFIQGVNARCTLLMTFEGDYVQIPNSTVYKSIIKNLTANPITRYEFSVGIGFSDSISQAQTIAMNVLTSHKAVSNEPEPLVLVESLGSATVNLRIYFWLDITKYSMLKVRSALIRLTKTAFEEAGISMPDADREVIFPQGIPMTVAGKTPDSQKLKVTKDQQKKVVNENAEHEAEGDLLTEETNIKEQVKNSTPPEKGIELL